MKKNIYIPQPLPLRVYAAGKIRRNDWRTGRGDAGSAEDDGFGDHVAHRLHATRNREKRLPGGLIYVGPYCWSAIEHVGCHQPNNHAAAYVACSDEEHWRLAQSLVRQNSFAQIRRADFVYARLDAVDAFGTVVEIGAAVAIGRPVFLDVPDSEVTQDMWFVIRAAMSSLVAGHPLHERMLHLIPWWTRGHRDVSALLAALESIVVAPYGVDTRMGF